MIVCLSVDDQGQYYGTTKRAEDSYQQVWGSCFNIVFILTLDAILIIQAGLGSSTWNQ